ncbi:MAG: Holliday junction resolvase RuvX [Actinobacteria bacterium]|nr:Holliday junction resolvase RuvX [Actinomycetota bacterium]
MRTGVRLAIDVGSVRIGVARSDPGGLMAVPLDAISANDLAFTAVSGLVDEYEAIEVVVGLPLSMDGTEGRAARLARGWAERLSAALAVPVRLVDERLTTVQAQRGLHAAGRSVKSSRGMIDSASAVILLQSDLDAERAKGSA